MTQRRKPGTTVWISPQTLEQIKRKKKEKETADTFIRRLMGIGMLLLIAIAPVFAAVDFQSPLNANLLNATPCTVFCGVQPNPFYVSNITGGNSYFDNGAGGSMFIAANPTTYWAGTIVRISPVGGGNIRIGLLDSSYNSLDTIDTPFMDIGTPHRYEVTVIGGTPYLYIDGIWKYNKTSAMSQNPSFVWIYSAYNSGYAEHSVDDITYGTSDSTTVLDMPQSNMYFLKKDMVNPSASGFYNSTTGALIFSNIMPMSFSRSNLTGQSLTNESIYLINADTGTVYETQYTGNNTTGIRNFNIGTSLVTSGAPYGFYQTKLGTTVSDTIAYIANGATITYDKTEYSEGDTAAINWVIDGAYWDTSTYTYTWKVADVYGTTLTDGSIITSTGSATFTWPSTATQGVYYLELIATPNAGGSAILMNYDYATLTATFGFIGYVNAAQTALPISAANVTYAQGDVIGNTSSGFDGNYSVTGFITGAPIWANVSATGYQNQNFTFIVTMGHTITRNITLNATSPSYVGLAIGGVTREGVFTSPNTITNGYGRPIPSATCYLKNTSNTEFYSTTGNNAGWYLFDETTYAFLTASRPYDLWCQRSGYSNSPNYTVVAE